MKRKFYKSVIFLLVMSSFYCCAAHVKVPERTIEHTKESKDQQVSDRYKMLLLERVLSKREDIYAKIKKADDEDTKKALMQLNQELEKVQTDIIESMNENSDKKAINKFEKAVTLLIKQINIEEELDSTKDDEEGKKPEGEFEYKVKDINKFYKKINNYFSKGDYEKIIDTIDSLDIPKEDLPLGIVYIYALSLERQGKEALASFVMSKALLGYNSTDRAGGDILYNIGTWLLEKKDFEGALRAFNYILEDFRQNNQWYIKAREKTELYSLNFQELLAKVKLEQAEKLISEGSPISEIREILKEIEDICPSCPSAKRAMELDQNLAEKQADEVENIYQSVDRLLEDNEFARALGLLEQVKEKYSIYDDNPNMRYLLSLLPDKINMVKRTELHLKQREEEKDFEKGKREYEKGNYTKALAIFEKSLETSLADEAEIMIKNCISKIVANERKRSAEIFLKAKDESNPEKKKELLQESYDILDKILQEYSRTTYKNKINANLKIIKQELRKLE
ncbi:MAG: hypothetical protein ACMUIP_12310 [bacterium]